MSFYGSGAAKALLPFLLAFQIASSTSCLARRRLITRAGGAGAQTLLFTNKEQLIRDIAQHYRDVQTINATVDMAPTLGTANKGKLTEYKDVRAYIVFRNPSDIRIIGLYPVV